MREGVIQFHVQHRDAELSEREREVVGRLLGWRTLLVDCGILGAQPDRYGGLGFGNVSHRVGARSRARGARAFAISGTQTSGIHRAGASHFAVVEEWVLRENRLVSYGSVRPSSESLTHATIYDQGPHLQCVLHVHSPAIWRAQEALGLPATPNDVAYGTPEMADATAALFRHGRVWDVGVFTMRGHEDGVVAFGNSVEEAGTRLFATLADARQRLQSTSQNPRPGHVEDGRRHHSPGSHPSESSAKQSRRH